MFQRYDITASEGSEKSALIDGPHLLAERPASFRLGGSAAQLLHPFLLVERNVNLFRLPAGDVDFHGPTLEPWPRDRDRVPAGCEGHAAVSQAELLGGSQEAVVQVDSRIAGLGRK